MILKRSLKFIHCFSRKKKNNIHSFQSNATNTNYFITFLQTVDVALTFSNNYWQIKM